MTALERTLDTLFGDMDDLLSEYQISQNRKLPIFRPQTELEPMNHSIYILGATQLILNIE